VATELLNDRALALSDDFAGLAAPGFTRIDRRPLIGMPPTDVEGYRQSHLALEELAGQWPSYHFHEVLAVRGDRLAAVRVSISVGEQGSLEQITLSQIDRDLQMCELLVIFDPDDLEVAIAELDRLHAEIEE
jgi:hypothetical protein